MGTGTSIILALPAGFGALGWYLAIGRESNRTELKFIVGFNVLFVLVVLNGIMTDKFPEFTQLLIWELILSPLVMLMASAIALIYKRFNVASNENEADVLDGKSNPQ